MKIKKIKIPTYNEFNQYRKEIYECLNRNYNKKIDMWLSDSPAQDIVIDCRNGYSFSFTYYYDIKEDYYIADLYALIFFEKDSYEEVPGFEFYTYLDHKIEIIANGVALTVKPIKQDIRYYNIFADKPLSKFIMSNGLMLHFTEQNEFVCDVVEKTPLEEVMDFTKAISNYAQSLGVSFIQADSLDNGCKDVNVLTVIKEPWDDPRYEYTIYRYNGNEFEIVTHIYRDPVRQGREQVYAKIKEVIDFLDKEVDDNVEPDACSIGIRAIEKLEKIIKEG